MQQTGIVRSILDLVAAAVAAAAERWLVAERALVASGRMLQTTHPGRALLRRVLDRLIRRLHASAKSHRVASIAGMRVVVDTATRPGRTVYFEQALYEAPVTRLVTELQAGDTFIDVGANVGFFTVLAALRVGPQGRVLAFEPNPEVRAQLEDNLARNGVAAVVSVEQTALTDRRGETALFLSERESGVSSVVPDRAPLPADLFSSSVTVRTATLDEYVEARALAPALVKIDVEGAEDLVLQGFTRTLATAPPPRIVCETAAGSAADRLLRAHGYEARRLDDSAIGNILYQRRSARGASRTPPG